MSSSDIELLKEQIKMLNMQVDSLIKQRDNFASIIGKVLRLCEVSDKLNS